MDRRPTLRGIDHVAGARDASVVVVGYGDYECPYCKAGDIAVRHLLARHADQVCVAFRHFPLMDVHRHALGAALASEAAAAQGRFWEMHDLLFQRQPQLAVPHLRAYAVALGLDMNRFDAALDDPVVLDRVLEDIDSGRASGVRATPTFFVNGELQDVSYGIEALVRRVQASLPNQ